MKSKLQFDHCYGGDQGHVFYKKLGRAGFYLSDYTVLHPSEHFCKFISIQSKTLSQKYYLEFVSIKKLKSNPKLGISFSSKSPLIKMMPKLKGMNPKYVHRNYDWKIDSKSDLPGWNFITFNRRSNTNIWLTEYEADPKRTKRVRKKLKKFNPNGVDRIESLHFSLSRKDFLFLKKILGQNIKDTFKLQDGLMIKFKIGKSTKLVGVSLSTLKFKEFIKKFEWDELISIDSVTGREIVYQYQSS